MAATDIATNIMNIVKSILDFCWGALKSCFYYPMLLWDWLPYWAHCLVWSLVVLLVLWLGVWVWLHRDDWREITG